MKKEHEGVVSQSTSSKSTTSSCAASIVQGRLESDLNAELASIIPIVYGALLSYAMYILARLTIEFVQFLTATSWKGNIGTAFSNFLSTVALYLCMAFFVAEDLGEVIKLAKVYPFRRTSRYSHELIIAFWFITTFALLEAQNNLAIGAFAIAVFWGGVWCNELRGEYAHDRELWEYATTQRNLQYVGAAAFILIQIVTVRIYHTTIITPLIAGAFTLVFVTWLVVYGSYLSHRHGTHSGALVVTSIIPDAWLIALQKRKAR